MGEIIMSNLDAIECQDRDSITREELDQLRKDAEIGKRWRENSSLEEWFPFTAKEMDDLRKTDERMREIENHRNELASALKLALEYWEHRQQRYKNRSPVWVKGARNALCPEKKVKK